MAYKNKSQAVAYINRYNAEKYDRVTLMLLHGQKKTLQNYAAARGESVNSFIKRAIQEAMERDNVAADGHTGATHKAGE